MNDICKMLRTGYNELTATPSRSLVAAVRVGAAVATVAAALYAPDMAVDKGASLFLR